MLTDTLPTRGGSRTQETRARILYATDPICSHCWAMEPAWRRFLYLYGDHVATTSLYGGLLPEWEGFADVGAGIREPADIPPHWQEVVDRYGQPIDGSVWHDDPLSSSYPPSVAVHAVRAIDPAREDDYLRRIRQAVFLEARNIARPEVLAECAADIGIDAARFLEVYRGPRAEQAFEDDLRMRRERGIRGFPTLIVTGPAIDEPRVMRGTQPFHRLERALEAVLGGLPAPRETTTAAVLEEYGSGTTAEFAEVLGMDYGAAAAELAAAGAQRRALADSHLWSAPAQGG